MDGGGVGVVVGVLKRTDGGVARAGLLLLIFKRSFRHCGSVGGWKMFKAAWPLGGRGEGEEGERIVEMQGNVTRRQADWQAGSGW